MMRKQKFKILGSYDKKTKLDKTMDIKMRKPKVDSKVKDYMKTNNQSLNRSVDINGKYRENDIQNQSSSYTPIQKQKQRRDMDSIDDYELELNDIKQMSDNQYLDQENDDF